MADERLTSRERTILKIFIDSNSLFEDELLELSPLMREQTLRSVILLEEKGFLEVNEHKWDRYLLTEEGKLYLEKGLPERQILEYLLKEGSTPIKTIRDVFSPELAGIALGWLKKKKWAKIDKGVLVAEGDVEKGVDERILELINTADPTSDELTHAKSEIEILKNRGLIEIEPHRRRRISITAKGIAWAEQNRDLIEREVKEITRITPELIRNGGWRDGFILPYDISVSAKRIYPAKIHPYQRILDRIRRTFIEMGFVEIKGEIIQSSFWNFDALFQPQDHPAREMQDTFYLDLKAELPEKFVEKVKAVHENGGDTGSKGWGGVWQEEVAKQKVLRTHTTSITIKYLADHPEPPAKVFCIDRVYRRETMDATHTPEFEQLEGIVMDEGVSFANLLGCLSTFYHLMGFEDVRFRPGYFPYTEPSVEAEVYVEGRGWIELGGAGVFREEVTKPFGIDVPVLAWGLGISRLAMIILGLDDLRKLYHSDIRWLKETAVCEINKF
ncbi:MAG: phenylalanyl-tRNA synthetase subunit alpha [Candidatus Syntrophoarchaeum caldarius]|uniref:Phenylalanine--tRNA ligase alpha subunit n=1 Tax=Candidatus Syntropharchaeum caldarium TaxID=1838285 RepID=A0A1F2P881_9EURY|nr:MAG: phenylalanyl-tRNA synthetase subunit alpha [Candidatus Syntrophoarchaeum caldarius]